MNGVVGWKQALALAGCALLAGAPEAALAQSQPEEPRSSRARDVGLGLGVTFGTLLYAPLKLAYAAGGVVIGGLGWAVAGGDSEVARRIILPSVGGDWVITPSHLTRERPLDFVGPTVEDRWDSRDVATPPSQPAEAPRPRETRWDADDPWSTGE